MNQHLQAVILYNPRGEGEVVGYDAQFAPPCVREHSYRYDSYDAKYCTLKYTCPKNVQLARYNMIHFVKKRIKSGNQWTYESIHSPRGGRKMD